MLSLLPGFYFAIELYIMFLFLLFAGIAIYYIKEKSKWGWRVAALFFAASIVNVLFLFTLAPQPILIILTIVASAGYIIALDHLNQGKLVFDTFNLEQIDVGGKMMQTMRRKTLGVLDEDRDTLRKKMKAALVEGYVEIPVPQTPKESEVEQYENIIEKRDFEYYTRQTPATEDRGIEEVTLDSLKATEPKEAAEEPQPIVDAAVEDSEKFLASPLSTKFHVPGCRWIQRLDKKEAIWFTSVGDAIKQGYSPCSCVDNDKLNTHVF